jgi:nucleotide-binding universal stress UspA family protein
MYKSIVVGTDGSETADIALHRAIALAGLTRATLHVVSAYEPAPARVGGNQPVPEAAEWSVGPDLKVDGRRACPGCRARSRVLIVQTT